MTGKYEPLAEWLSEQRTSPEVLAFTQIERIIGDRLSPSARTDRTWWGNTTNAGRSQSKAWLGAGWEVAAVDFGVEVVTFQRR